MYRVKGYKSADGRILDVRPVKNHKYTLAVGFWSYNEAGNHGNAGTYCIIDFDMDEKNFNNIKKNIPKENFHTFPKKEGGKGYEYCSLLKDVLGNETNPEKQKEKLLAFYEKMLNLIIKAKK